MSLPNKHSIENVETVWNNIRAKQGDCFVYQMTTIKQPCGTYDRIYPLAKGYIESLFRSGSTTDYIKQDFINKADYARLLISSRPKTSLSFSAMIANE